MRTFSIIALVLVSACTSHGARRVRNAGIKTAVIGAVTSGVLLATKRDDTSTFSTLFYGVTLPVTGLGLGLAAGGELARMQAARIEAAQERDADTP